MPVKLRALTALACAAVLALSGCGSDSGSGAAPGAAPIAPKRRAEKPLKVRGKGYSFIAPVGWSKVDPPKKVDAMVVMVDSDGSPLASVTVVLPPTENLTDVGAAQQVYQGQLEAQGFNDIQQVPAPDVGGEQAVGLDGRLKISVPPTRTRTPAGETTTKPKPTTLGETEVLTFHDGRLYVIRMSGPPRGVKLERGDFKRILRSWRWRKG